METFRVQVTKGVREARQVVVPEVEHPKPCEAADALGHLGQRVLGQDERLEVGSSYTASGT